MALPTFKAAGTFTAGTAAITPPYPTGGGAPALNDIAILVVESENQVISLTTPNGFAELGAQANKAAGTAAVDPASRLAVYWKRCAGGDAAPVVAAPGNHATARIYLFSGCKTSDNPWNVYAEGNDGGANDLTGVIPGATTTVADCLIFLICTSSYNSTQTTEFGTTAFWTNADLANIVERGDNTNTAGLGGGHGSATGEKASAGAYVNTTVSLAHTSYKGAMSIALEPPSIVTEYGAATLSGAGTLAGIGTRVRRAACALSGIGTVTAAAYRVRTGLTTLSGVGSVAAIGGKVVSARATVTGTGTVVAAGRQISAALAMLQGTGLITISGVRLRSGLGVLSGAGAVTGVGLRQRIALIALAGLGTLASTGTRLRAALANLVGAGVASASSVRLRMALALTTGLGALTSLGTRLRDTLASLLGIGLLSAVGEVVEGGGIKCGSAMFSGVGKLSVSADQTPIPDGPAIFHIGQRRSLVSFA